MSIVTQWNKWRKDDPTEPIRLAGVWLDGADLRNARMTDACLEGAWLEGADLEDAWLTGANLTGANLTGARLAGAWLNCADLRNARLAGACLEGANLRGARLEGARLEGADLEDACLEGADLEGANLYRARLEGTRLNWTSHDLIAEILRQAAGKDSEKRSMAGLVLVSRDWCWKDFARNVNSKMKRWCAEVLTPFVDKETPEDIKQLVVCEGKKI